MFHCLTVLTCLTWLAVWRDSKSTPKLPNKAMQSIHRKGIFRYSGGREIDVSSRHHLHAHCMNYATYIQPSSSVMHCITEATSMHEASHVHPT